jgi:hypothetical protein
VEFKAYDLAKRLKEKEAEHTKAMATVLQDHEALEQEHRNTINKMKDAEAVLRLKKEKEVAELQDKISLLESECIQSIGKAREEGKQEVRAEVAEQLKGVFNRGFRDRWKSALKKAGIPSSSDMFERSTHPSLSQSWP